MSAGRGKWWVSVVLVMVSVRLQAATSGEAGVEFVGADAIDLWQAGASAQTATGNWDNTFSLAHNRFTIGYEPVPFDFRGVSRSRRESTTAVQWNGRREVSENWTVMMGGGVSHGFTNYRSVWLDEYFHQQYGDPASMAGADTYTVADPHGFNVSGGARWAYQPGSGFAQLSASWLQDEVAPGYEIDFDGLRRGQRVLATTAINVSFENVLTTHIRSLVEVRAVKTSGREWRLGLEAGGNIALGERWVLRLQAGTTTESPQFEAYYGSATLEYEVTPAVAVFASARYYEDTGEIENALLFTSAAPGLHSRQWGAGVRWKGEEWAVRLYAAPLRTRYDPTNPNTDFFQNLYADRNWTVVQFALARSFGS